jgi:uncharacterized protein
MKFVHLTPERYPELKPFFTKQRYRLCTYSLPAIIVWSNTEYQPYGTVKDDALIVYADFVRQLEKRHLILPISPEREYSPEALSALADDLGFRDVWFVPDEYIARFGRKRIGSRFDISEQREYRDYVYRVRDLTLLEGNRYAKKRNLIHQFEKVFSGNGRVRVDPLTTRSIPGCLAFLEEWCEDHGCDSGRDEDLACEKEAAINAIKHGHRLGMSGLTLSIEGKVSAFALASHLTEGMGVLHFQKAFSRCKGLYQYFDQVCARRLFEGYTYVNKESDMNLPGLARAKKSYHPAMMIRSYRLSRKENG